MPAGSRGKSAKVRYVTDSAKNIVIRVPQYILDGGKHGLQPTDGTEVAKPDGFKPRVVFWEGFLPAVAPSTQQQKIRRSIPCNAGALLIASDARQSHTLDGVVGETTGRKGEKVSFE